MERLAEKVEISDTIPPKVIKADTGVTANIMIDVLQVELEKGEMPTECKTGSIVKIPKKGKLERYPTSISAKQVLH